MATDRSLPPIGLPLASEPGRRLALAAPPLERTWLPLLRDGVRPLFVSGDLLACVLGAVALGPTHPAVAVAFGLVLVIAYAQTGLYRSRLALSVLVDVPRVVGGWILALSAGLATSQLLDLPVAFPSALMVLVAVVLFRVVNYTAVRLMRSSGKITHGTIVLGAGRTGNEIADRIRRHPESGLRVLGFLDNASTRVDTHRTAMLGGPSDLSRVLAEYRPRALMVAYGSVRENELVDTVRACQRHRCEVFVVPRLYEIQHVAADMDFVGDVPLVRLRRAAYRSWAWPLKRVFDATFAALALTVLSPLLLACALAVRLEGGKGVIFRQERVGCDGRHFELMKFRSMRPVDETESRTNWNISHDDRLGPVGRFLRKSSIDELPQLLNILRGDMSFVGPRPERPHFVKEFGLLYRGYNARHRVPCGLTGWAQVHGLRGDTSIDERARFDNFYIENWSLWLDIMIVMRTVVSVFRSPGS